MGNKILPKLSCPLAAQEAIQNAECKASSGATETCILGPSISDHTSILLFLLEYMTLFHNFLRFKI